jgi:hypothetical protein
MRRDIVVTAKQIATLDHFGKGRLELGVGIGAHREEFDALQPDSPSLRNRWQAIHNVFVPPASAACACAATSPIGARPSIEMPMSAMIESAARLVPANGGSAHGSASVVRKQHLLLI